MWHTVYTNQLNSFRKQLIASWLIKTHHRSVGNYGERFQFRHFIASLCSVLCRVNWVKLQAFIHHVVPFFSSYHSCYLLAGTRQGTGEMEGSVTGGNRARIECFLISFLEIEVCNQSAFWCPWWGYDGSILVCLMALLWVFDDATFWVGFLVMRMQLVCYTIMQLEKLLSQQDLRMPLEQVHCLSRGFLTKQYYLLKFRNAFPTFRGAASACGLAVAANTLYLTVFFFISSWLLNNLYCHF